MRIALILLVVIGSLAAQAADGTLSGVVRDASGGTVPKALVTVTMAAGNVKEFVATKETGEFFLSPLPEGVYTVTVEKAGFALNRQEGIEVSGARPARMEVVLNVGRVRESLEVVAKRPAGAAPPPAAAGTPMRIRVGGSVAQSKLVSQVKPEYPAGAKAEGVEGSVLLRAVISKEGVPLNLEPVNRLVDARLVEAAVQSVRQWRYQPTLLNGQPVEVVTEIQVNFVLQR